MELHGAGVHLFLTTPFSPAVLEPDLGMYDYNHTSDIYDLEDRKVRAIQLFAFNVFVF